MNKWFKVTVKAYRNDPDGGKEKKVTEQYLFDALSYTEVERRAIEDLKPYYNAFEISKIDPVKMSELFLNENGDRYFKCKVNYITLDEKKGREKKTPCYIYVQANDPKNAEQVLSEGMKGTVSDWSCEAIAETKILDVFKFDLKKASEELSKESEKEFDSDKK